MHDSIVPSNPIDRQSTMGGPIGPVLATARLGGDVWRVIDADGRTGFGILTHPCEGVWEPVAAHEITIACERLRELIQLADHDVDDVVVVDERTIRAHGPTETHTEPIGAVEVGSGVLRAYRVPSDGDDSIETAAEAAAEKAADHGPAAGPWSTTASSRAAEPHPHADVIAGLREMADWLEVNPDVPVSSALAPYVAYHPDRELGNDGRRAEIDRVAEMIGAAAGYPWEGAHYQVKRRFRGGVHYQAVYVQAVERPEGGESR